MKIWKLCLALGFYCALPSWTQEATGRILGTVTDVTGASVPGASVTASSPTLPGILQTISDAAGRFTLTNVPIGTYTIAVAKDQFATLRQHTLEVHLGSEVLFNAVLKLGIVTDAIEVRDSESALETTSSRTSTNIPQSIFERLPRGRTFNSILQLAPGVRLEPKNGTAGVGGIQVDGASGSENAYFIDGVEVSDLRRGFLSQQHALPFEMIQEVQIKSGGFEAEYGGATGGVINLATRGGSKELHGEALFQFTGSALNSRDRGGWIVNPRDTTRADFIAPKEDSYRLFYPGATLGGPVPKLRDKAYFFGSYFPEVERTRRQIDYSADPVNRVLGLRNWYQTDTRHYGQGRIDITPSPKWQVATSYLWSPEKQIGVLPSRDIRLAPPTNDLSIQGGYRPAQSYTVSANYSPSSRLLISARYGYRYLNDKLGNYGLSSEPFVFYTTPSSAAPGVPAAFAGDRGYSNVSNTYAVIEDVSTRRNIYLDATYIGAVHGQQHTLKAGYAMNRVSSGALEDFTNGSFTIFWGDAYSRGPIENQRGTYGYYIWDDGPKSSGEAHSRNHGFYVQDAWRAHTRLTLSLGVRFENEFLPPYTKEVRGIRVLNPISFGWGDKIAPRLGASWDVRGDGRWKLSGSFGLFYDVLKYELARIAFGLIYHSSSYYRLDNPNVFSLSRSNPGALGARIDYVDNVAIPINARGELEGIDPAVKPYQTREFTTSLEHAITRRLTLSIRYTRKDLLRTIEDYGILDARGAFSFIVGNPGFGVSRNDPTHVRDAKTPDGRQYLIPKAVRQYDGLEFRLLGRWNRFFLATNYTYSRLYGNYSGIASSDESGRSDPGLSIGFDLPFYYFDSSGSQRHIEGRLGTDRPHTFKLFASHEWKSRAGISRLGLNQTAYSGTLDSTTVNYAGSLTFPNGRGDLGRTPVLTQTDVLLHHDVRVGEKRTLRLEADVRNLLNQDAVLARVSRINRTQGISMPVLPFASFFNGYKLADYVNPANRILAGPRTGAAAAPYMASYGLPNGSFIGRWISNLGPAASSAKAVALPNWGGYQDFRVLRVGLRFIF